ncbi:hypothetical protein D910_01092 [Dendroctonus ponderosae]|uniref:Helix-turn-helix domain-containing protein n=1 Tax=Dendroctonus ponderosae TaxID=77166 RepID=U4USM6_DENPD|nr:hypothetical protein D910_01092 [Dendroctonus ponderosae]
MGDCLFGCLGDQKNQRKAGPHGIQKTDTPTGTCPGVQTIIPVKKEETKTLTERARRICEPAELERELKHLERAFGFNGYSKKDINRAIRPKNKDCSETTETHDERKSWACLPYIHGVTDRIGKILETH